MQKKTKKVYAVIMDLEKKFDKAWKKNCIWFTGLHERLLNDVWDSYVKV